MTTLHLRQRSCWAQPRALTAARLGVGACIWDGALVLAAYLAAQPPGTFAGEAQGRPGFKAVLFSAQDPPGRDSGTSGLQLSA